MSEIKALEKLRKNLKNCTTEAGVEPNKFDTYWITADACDKLIDDIEAEISERYIKLPTDKNGNVIHVGDMVKHADGDVYEVLGVDNDGTRQGVFINTGSGRYPIDSWCASGMELYKPRTLEDILSEYGHAYYAHMTDNYMNYDGTDEQIIKKYANEIHDLFDKQKEN